MPADQTPPMQAMARTAKWSRAMFDSLDRDDCMRWKHRLINKARFILVDLAAEGIDRFLAFDAINSRGLPLSQFDKIKNFCMLIKSARALSIKPEKLWHDSIHKLEVYSVGTRTAEESYISELFGVVHNERSSPSKVHETFVTKYRKLASQGDPALEANISRFMALWPGYAASYAFLSSSNRHNHYGAECSMEAGKWLDRLDNLGLPAVTRPVLAAGHMTYSQSDFEVLAQACEIFTFRIYAICGYRIDKNARDIIEIAHEILSNSKAVNEVLQTFCSLLSKQAPSSRVVEKLTNADPKYSFAKGGWNYGYYFLYEYEVGVSPAGVSPLPWATNKEEKRNTQEHILPQSHRDGSFWESHWPDEARANRYCDRLGNLVLTSGNSVLARKEISLKLDDPSATYSFNCTDATNS